VKFILRPDQLLSLKESELKELVRPRGHYSTNPLQDFFDYMLHKMKLRDFEKLFKKYYGDKLGMDLSLIDDDKIYNYYRNSFNPNYIDSSRNKKVFNYDARNGFAFEIAKKTQDLKSTGFGVDYIIVKEGTGKSFYFFDNVFKIFVGKISTETVKGKGYKGTVLEIVTSGAERKLIGMGYGIKMYVAVLENCDYLESSSLLFSGSYRIWSQVLPRYANVWWKIEGNNFGKPKKDFVKIDPSQPFKVPSGDIEHFVASIYHKKI
jgi:hypothetical protein